MHSRHPSSDEFPANSVLCPTPSIKPMLKQGVFSRIDIVGNKSSMLDNKENDRNKSNILVPVSENRNQMNKSSLGLSGGKKRPKFGGRQPLMKDEARSPAPKGRTPTKIEVSTPQKGKKSSRQGSVKPLEPLNEFEDIEKLKEELEKERRNANEYKKRLNNEKVVIANLKNRIKTLEDDKTRQDEGHRKSFVGIEQKVATLKNTNLQLLNKAHRFDDLKKELEEAKVVQATVKDRLNVLRDTFTGKHGRQNEKLQMKAIQRKVISFFQSESESICDLGMQQLFQGIFEELIESQKRSVMVSRAQSRGRSRSNSSHSELSSIAGESIRTYKRKQARHTPPRPKPYMLPPKARESPKVEENKLGRMIGRSSSLSSSVASKSDASMDRIVHAKLLEQEYKNIMNRVQDDEEIQIEKTDDEGAPEEIDIQPAEYLRVANQRSAKNHESNTTRADTVVHQLNIKAAEPVNPFSFGSHNSGSYQSTKFAFANIEEQIELPADENVQGTASPTESQQGLLSRKLKEAMRLATSSAVTKAPEQKKDATPGPSLATRDWNSLSTTLPHENQGRGQSEFLLSRVQSQGGSTNVSQIEHRSLGLIERLREQTSKHREETYMKAMYEFVGQTSKDLSFKKGDIVRLIDKKKDGWWLAEVDGRIGFVPSNYLVEAD